MKTNIATTSDQSARLLKCGVPAESADMSIDTDTNKLYLGAYSERVDKVHEVPAWSLSRLLELLPTSILSPLGNEYMLELSKRRMHDAWEIQWVYVRNRFVTYDKHHNFHRLWDKSPIGACVKAIEWLTENNYKLNQI